MVEERSCVVYLVIGCSYNNIQSRTCHTFGIVPLTQYSEPNTFYTKVFTYYHGPLIPNMAVRLQTEIKIIMGSSAKLHRFVSFQVKSLIIM